MFLGQTSKTYHSKSSLTGEGIGGVFFMLPPICVGHRSHELSYDLSLISVP